MRRVIYFVIYILLIFWLIYLSISYVIKVNVVKTHNNSNSFKKLYKLSYNFVLETNQTFRYDIPSFSDYVRFVFTPNIYPSEDLNSNINNLIFAIKYQVFDSNDRVIQTKIIYLKSSYFIYINRASEPTITQFYLNSPLIPAKSKTLLINLNGLKSVRYIKLTLISKDNRLADIGVRGYFLEREEVKKLSKVWGRLNQEKREKLFIGNVYPLYYISKEEKRIRLQKLFKPMAPYKVEERGYKIRKLLTLKDTSGIFPYISVEPLIYSDSNLNATRVLQQGRYRVDITGKGNTTINIYNSISLISSKDFNNTKHISLDLNQSYLLELISPTPQSYTITDINKSIREYLPPRVSYGYYYIDKNSSIEYNLSRADNRILLIESRVLDINDTNNTLQITISNRAGKIIKRFNKITYYTPSKYHYIDKFQPISEANRTNLPFPHNATNIEISSLKPALIKLYSRDINLPYPLYSFKSFDYPLFTKLSPWLFIRANSDTNTSQIKQIYIQPKPPTISQMSQIGEYKFETIYPKNLWIGFDILQKRLRDINYIRKEAYNSIYSLIDENMTLNFLSDDNTTISRVKLICIAEKPSQVIFDNRVLNNLCQTKGISTYRLQNISNIPHQISLTNSRVKLFISNTAIKNRVYIKNSFIKFDKPLSFEVVKKSLKKELLKIQLAKKIDDNISIEESLFNFDDINISSRLFEEFSFKSYQLYFDIGATRGYLIRDRSIDIGVSKPLYLPIGENLKDNLKFTIYPKKDSNSSYYINISHIIEGIKDNKIIVNFNYH